MPLRISAASDHDIRTVARRAVRANVAPMWHASAKARIARPAAECRRASRQSAMRPIASSDTTPTASVPSSTSATAKSTRPDPRADRRRACANRSAAWLTRRAASSRMRRQSVRDWRGQRPWARQTTGAVRVKGRSRSQYVRPAMRHVRRYFVLPGDEKCSCGGGSAVTDIYSFRSGADASAAFDWSSRYRQAIAVKLRLRTASLSRASRAAGSTRPPPPGRR